MSLRSRSSGVFAMRSAITAGLFFFGSVGQAFAQLCTSANMAKPTGDMVSTLSYQLMLNCWSCKLYSSIYYGLRAMVNTSYAALISTSAGSLGLPILGVTILAITLLVKFIPFLVGTGDSFELLTGLRMFFVRISVVFLMLIGASGAKVVAGNGIVSDFLIDGPLAMGTSVALSLSNVTSAALDANIQGLSGQPVTSLYGAYGDVPSGDTADMDGGTSGFAAEHVAAATQILWHLHQMGVVGLVTGLWMAIEDPSTSVSNLGNTVVGESAALFLIWSYFMFTLTFGLKYIDALIRTMLIFSLSPLFFYLWIFDSTRSMAIQAIKSGLSLACVFAVSGVVYTVAYYILELGFLNVFQNQNLAFPGLQSLLCGLGATTISNIIGSSGQGASLNWMSYFYLVGSASVSTACASMTFDLAGQIFAFNSAEMGIASAVKGEMSQGMSQAMDTLRGGK